MENRAKINDTDCTNEEILIEQSSDEKPKKPLKQQKCCEIRPFLRKVSVGQYSTKLYNDGQDTESSSIGGLITIVIGLLIVTYAIIVMNDIIKQVN